LKEGDALSPLLFNFASGYAIRRVRVKQEGLKLNGVHQVLVYADDINISVRSIRTTNEYTNALRFDNKKTWLEVNADKSKHMDLSRVQNARRRQNKRLIIASQYKSVITRAYGRS
jgi:hypothetical protein